MRRWGNVVSEGFFLKRSAKATFKKYRNEVLQRSRKRREAKCFVRSCEVITCFNFFQIQFDCIIQIQNSQCNVSVVNGNSNMIILHLLRLNFTKTWYCMDDISLRNSLWWKKPSGFHFCSMGKTKKLSFYHLYPKRLEKKTYTITELKDYAKMFWDYEKHFKNVFFVILEHI